MSERVIRIGRPFGTVTTPLKPADIAHRRAQRIDSLSDRGLFLDTFVRVYSVAASLPDLDTLWTVMGGRYMDPVMEAAAIEALAGMRAEGWRG
jgi:hypothetical protein